MGLASDIKPLVQVTAEGDGEQRLVCESSVGGAVWERSVGCA
jgi:hypothetical protein